MNQVVDELKANGFQDSDMVYALKDSGAIVKAKERWPQFRYAPYPFEFGLPVFLFLLRVRPDALLFVERFQSPMLAIAARRLGIPVVVVNGRTRVKKGSVYRWSGWFYRWRTAPFKLLIMQEQEQADSLLPFVGDDARIVVSGDMKMLREPPTPSIDLTAFMNGWKDKQGIDRVLIAGSVNSLEEGQFTIDSLASIVLEKKAIAMLAPRYIQHTDDLISMAEAAGLKAGRRSLGETDAPIVILDTFGELSSVYSFGFAAYVGGAFSGMGHNVLEPIAFGVPVSYGPQRGHFQECQQFAERYDASRRLKSTSDLAAFWREAFDNSKLVENAGMAREALRQHAERSRQTVSDAIREFCEQLD